MKVFWRAAAIGDKYLYRPDTKKYVMLTLRNIGRFVRENPISFSAYTLGTVSFARAGVNFYYYDKGYVDSGNILYVLGPVLFGASMYFAGAMIQTAKYCKRKRSG